MAFNWTAKLANRQCLFSYYRDGSVKECVTTYNAKPLLMSHNIF